MNNAQILQEVSDAPAAVLPQVVSRRQAAIALGVCKYTVRRWELAGLIQPIRINSRLLRYRVADIERLLA
jgi:predicted site-specific integrase-resolvase